MMLSTEVCHQKNRVDMSHVGNPTQASMGESHHAPSKFISSPRFHVLQCLILNPERRPVPIHPSVHAKAQRTSFAQCTRHEIQLTHTSGRPVPSRPNTPRTSRWEIIWILVWIKLNLITVGTIALVVGSFAPFANARPGASQQAVGHYRIVEVKVWRRRSPATVKG